MIFLKLGVTFVKSLSALIVPGKCSKRIDNEKFVAGESLASDSTPSDISGYPKVQQPHYDLLRFLDAQEVAYTQALSELLKLKTSMRLFNKVSPNDVFEEVLDAFF